MKYEMDNDQYCSRYLQVRMAWINIGLSNIYSVSINDPFVVASQSIIFICSSVLCSIAHVSNNCFPASEIIIGVHRPAFFCFDESLIILLKVSLGGNRTIFKTDE